MLTTFQVEVNASDLQHATILMHKTHDEVSNTQLRLLESSRRLRLISMHLMRGVGAKATSVEKSVPISAYCPLILIQRQIC